MVSVRAVADAYLTRSAYLIEYPPTLLQMKTILPHERAVWEREAELAVLRADVETERSASAAEAEQRVSAPHKQF